MIKENLEEVEARITRACERSGRERSEVTLISVSKTKPVEMLQEAYEAGSRDFGENKPQEIREKYPQDVECVLDIAAFLKQRYGYTLSEEEILYLSIHVSRIHQVSVKGGEAV